MTYRFYIGDIPKNFDDWMSLADTCIKLELEVITNLAHDEQKGHDYYIEFPSEEDAVLFRLTHL